MIFIVLIYVMCDVLVQFVPLDLHPVHSVALLLAGACPGLSRERNGQWPMRSVLVNIRRMSTMSMYWIHTVVGSERCLSRPGMLLKQVQESVQYF